MGEGRYDLKLSFSCQLNTTLNVKPQRGVIYIGSFWPVDTSVQDFPDWVNFLGRVSWTVEIELSISKQGKEAMLPLLSAPDCSCDVDCSKFPPPWLPCYFMMHCNLELWPKIDQFSPKLFLSGHFTIKTETELKWRHVRYYILSTQLFYKPKMLLKKNGYYHKAKFLKNFLGLPRILSHSLGYGIYYCNKVFSQ